MSVSISNIWTIIEAIGTYTYYREGEYAEYTDGIDTYREGVRSGDFVIDKELTATGFSGTENVDWENVRVDLAASNTIWRQGIRSGNAILDSTLTTLGFGGVEDTDWENVR